MLLPVRHLLPLVLQIPMCQVRVVGFYQSCPVPPPPSPPVLNRQCRIAVGTTGPPQILVECKIECQHVCQIECQDTMCKIGTFFEGRTNFGIHAKAHTRTKSDHTSHVRLHGSKNVRAHQSLPVSTLCLLPSRLFGVTRTTSSLHWDQGRESCKCNH